MKSSLFESHFTSINQQIHLPLLEEKEVQLWIKREDNIHPEVSGNKFRKLKYNLKAAKELGKETVLTFGGAYSNHILATAAAANMSGLKSIGVIRGEELGVDINATLENNPTLGKASEYGMKFVFLTREEYRTKSESAMIDKLSVEHGDFYLIPEGGTNQLAAQGCEEILTDEDVQFDYICSCAGTGGTVSGLINSAKPHQTVIGFPALKGDFLSQEIEKYVSSEGNWKLIADYHFGGYAKYSKELIDFINEFKNQTRIQLDPIYTAKMIYGILDQIRKDQFPKGSKILAIHTGGLQGIQGVNQQLKKKNKPYRIDL